METHMECVIFIGIQASGKSTFCRDRFFRTHVRVNLDMLKTRHRESRLVQTCIETRQPFVVDNTNPTIEDRRRYINLARAASFRVVGYYFESRIDSAIERNAARGEEEQVPHEGIRGTHARLELPTKAEGFDALRYVRIMPSNGFMVEEWNDEV